MSASEELTHLEQLLFVLDDVGVQKADSVHRLPDFVQE